MNYHHFIVELALREGRPHLLQRFSHWNELGFQDRVLVESACLNYGRQLASGRLAENLDDM